MGRPSTFTQELADSILEAIAEGEKSLREICKADGMPGLSTLLRWVKENGEFQEQYTRAMEVRAAVMFDELRDISDDGSNDWMVRNGEDCPGYQLNGEHVQRSKLRIDARKWMLSKMLPKVYGDKIAQEISGPEGGPVQMAPAMSDEKMDALAEKIAKARERREQ